MFPPMKPRGTLYGIHAESSSQAIPLITRYAAAGVQIATLIGVENPGLCVDAKRIDPRILTIARWAHKSTEFEGGGHQVADWPQEKRQEFARLSIQAVFERANWDEYNASDYFQCSGNEWDPPWPGYIAMGEILCMVCDEATRRSPEKVALGQHPIRLGLCVFNAGTPEFAEMVQLAETGLFAKMKERGDILIVHEGVFWDRPIDYGIGGGIPGAPANLPDAGGWCFRSDYLYKFVLEPRGEVVPMVVTEWYDGNRRTTAPEKRLAAMQWYDREARKRYWHRGFCPFELTDDQDSSWYPVDFTPTYQSDEMLADMVAEKTKANPTQGDDEMADLQSIRAKAVEIRAKAQEIIDEVDGPQWSYQVRVKAGTLNVRSGPGVGNPDIGDVHAGDVLGVYQELNGWGRIDPAAQRWINAGTQYVERL